MHQIAKMKQIKADIAQLRKRPKITADSVEEASQVADTTNDIQTLDIIPIDDIKTEQGTDVDTDENISLAAEPEASDELQQLLTKWGFERLYEEFKNQRITLRRLEYLTESDLRDIYGLRKVGDRAEFRYQLVNWRKQHFLGNPTPCETSYNLPKDNFLLKNQTTKPQTPKTATENNLNNSQSTDIPPTTSPSYSINFDEVLTDHPAGLYVLRMFNESHALDNTARKILVDAIVTWFIKRNIKLFQENIEAISEEIAKRFQDDKHIYFTKDSKTSRKGGRLYCKYFNTVKMYGSLVEGKE